MIRITTAQLWVTTRTKRWLYTDKVGMEIRTDVTLPEMGNSVG